MTSSFATRLARRIDEIADGTETVLLETDLDVVLTGLSAASAAELAMLCLELEWAINVEDGSDSECSLDQLGEDLEPYRLVIHKPASDELRYLTNAGFQNWLSNATSVGCISVCQLTSPFETLGFSVVPWYSEVLPSLHPALKSPRMLVRLSGGVRDVPDDIRPWMLGGDVIPPWSDPVYHIWARVSAMKLIYAVASEIDPTNGFIVFAGSPKVRLQPPDCSTFETLGADGFQALQGSARWIFENDRETETRHKLFSLEIARSTGPGLDAGTVFVNGASEALEGARLAFQLGLEDLSRDAIRVLAELRKTLGDDASKLADSTRQLAAGVAGALFLGIGLIAARFSSNASRPLVMSLAFVLTGYVTSLVLINLHYLFLQRSIREEWRGRLYRFLTPDDYSKMVLKPANAAEKVVYLATGAGWLLTVSMVAAIWCLS